MFSVWSMTPDTRDSSTWIAAKDEEFLITQFSKVRLQAAIGFCVIGSADSWKFRTQQRCRCTLSHSQVEVTDWFWGGVNAGYFSHCSKSFSRC